MASVVYFTRDLSPQAVCRLYDACGKKLTGHIAVKVHSGEKGNQNYLPPAFWKPMVDGVHGTVVECNTAYDGARNTTARHRALLREHGWSDAFATDLLDFEGPDLCLPVASGLRLRENYVGKNLKNYDSLLVLSHFKGHPVGGYGGALKQLSIGIASAAGKAYIHSAGVTKNPAEVWGNMAPQPAFCEAMADAAASVVRFFGGEAVYINAMKNLSVDCDCCAVAEDPCMKDVGILASLDPVALDRASLDRIYAATDDPGRAHFLERVESRGGAHTIEAASSLGIGSETYELVEI